MKLMGKKKKKILLTEAVLQQQSRNRDRMHGGLRIVDSVC